MKLLASILIVTFLANAGQTQTLDHTPSETLSSNIDLVESLRDGHRIRISTRSLGCFHDAHDIIDISDNAASIKGLGDIQLSASHLVQLDEYFDQIRASGDRGYCTTEDTFELSEWSGERLIRKEVLKDSNCTAFVNAIAESRGERFIPMIAPSYLINLARAKHSELPL